MMTKKYYKQIAEVLKKTLDREAQWVIKGVAQDLADILEQYNPNFRRGTFLAACGLRKSES